MMLSLINIQVEVKDSSIFSMMLTQDSCRPAKKILEPQLIPFLAVRTTTILAAQLHHTDT
jgi:hypothetical protein